MTISITQINALPTAPTKDWPTHLQDHSTVHLALQEYIPMVILHQNTISTLAPLASPTFTGTAIVPALKFGGSSVAGQVLTASNTTGTVGWATPAVTSVANKSGAIELDVTDVAGAAPLDSPQFQNSIATPAITITGGVDEPKPGYVLTAENEGGGSYWAKPITSGPDLLPAIEDYRGFQFIKEGAPGAADELYVCLRQTSGQVAWIKIA